MIVHMGDNGGQTSKTRQQPRAALSPPMDCNGWEAGCLWSLPGELRWPCPICRTHLLLEQHFLIDLLLCSGWPYFEAYVSYCFHLMMMPSMQTCVLPCSGVPQAEQVVGLEARLLDPCVNGEDKTHPERSG